MNEIRPKIVLGADQYRPESFFFQYDPSTLRRRGILVPVSGGSDESVPSADPPENSTGGATGSVARAGSSKIEDPVAKAVADAEIAARMKRKELEKANAEKEAKLLELQTKLQEFELKDKSELERVQAISKTVSEERDKLKEELESSKTQIKEMMIRLAVVSSPTAARLHNPSDAMTLIDKGKLQFGEDGQPTNVEDLLKEAETSRPYMFKEKAEDKQVDATRSGEPFNGSNRKDGLDLEALARKYPSLRGRVYG